MLSVKNLVKIYINNERVQALDDVSVDFPATGMVFVLGDSGAGKSTLLNIAGGLAKPDSGEMILNGKSSRNFTRKDHDAYRNANVGFIFQNYNVLNDLTVGQNVALALRLQGKKDTATAIAQTLAAAGLADLGRRKACMLSDGQKIRVAIARALAKDARIVIADEPVGALDRMTGKEILDTLKKISVDRLVIVATRNRESAETYGDRIIELKDGKIAADTQRENQNAKPPAAACGAKKPEFIKPRLPLSCAAKMGLSSLKRHKFRLAVTLIISIAAITMFGVAATMMTYDPQTAMAEVVSNTSAALMSKNYCYDADVTVYDSDNDDRSYTQAGTAPARFGIGEIAELNKKAAAVGLSFAGVFMTADEENNQYNKSESPEANIDLRAHDSFADMAAYYYSPAINWFADCGEAYLRQTFGDDCLLAGAYPAKSDEIALSEYHYGIFQKYGYADKSAKSTSVINSPSDLIGKTLSLYRGRSMTVTGVYRVGAISERYAALKEISASSPAADKEKYARLKNEFDNDLANSFHTTAFVSESFYEKYGSIRSKAAYERLYPGNAQINVVNNRASDNDGYYRSFLSFDGLSEISGAKIYHYAGNAGNALSQQQCLISIKEFMNIAAQLNAAVKSGETATYGETHPEFARAYKDLEKATAYESLFAVNENDIEVVLNAMKSDWDKYAAYNDQGYEAYDSYFYGTDRKPLEIVGVVYSDRFSEANNQDFLVLNMDFVRSNAAAWRYLETIRTTKYTAPADARYSFVLSPKADTSEAQKFILEMINRDKASDVSYALQNDFYDEAVRLGFYFTLSGLGLLLFWLPPLGIFAALLLFNFMRGSIADRQKETGVLRASGARGKDVFKIFLPISAVIAGICFALSALIMTIGRVISGALPPVANANFLFLSFGIPQLLIVFAISLALTFIGTIIPISIAASKSPAANFETN